MTPFLSDHLVITLCVCMSAPSLSPVQLCATLWTVAHQAPLTMEFSKQEYQTGLPFLPPGDLPNPGIEPASPKSLALTGRFFYHCTTWEANYLAFGGGV